MSSGESCEAAAHPEFVHITQDHELQLCNRLYQQWQDGQLCDLTLALQGGELKAHSCIVAAFSPKLKVLIDNSARSSHCSGSDSVSSGSGSSSKSSCHQICIQLTFELDVFRCLLNLMYTGVLSFNTLQLSSVMSTARWLQMDEVVKLCQEYQDMADGCSSATQTVFSGETVLFEVGAETEGDGAGDQGAAVVGSEPGKGGGGKGKKKGDSSGSAVEPTPSRKRRHPSKVRSSSPSRKAGRKRASPHVEVSKASSSGTERDHDSLDTAENGSVSTSAPERASRGRRSARGRPKKSLASPKSGTKQQPRKGGGGTEVEEVTIKLERISPDRSQEPGQEEGGAASSPGSKALATMSHSEWVQSLSADDPDKEELDFALGRKGHITCKRCVVRFTKVDEYFHHVTNHPTFTCDICLSSYYRKSNLTRHMRTFHFQQHHLKCQQCGHVAQTEKSLRMHFKEVHHIDKPFACDHPGCTYATWKFDFLNRHKEIHSEVKRYMCVKCGQGFAQHAGLMSHQRACYHLQQFLCDLCGQSFNHVQSMRSHRRTIHLGEKPFMCKTCGNQFSDQRNLKRHTRIHDNLFPYQCPICKQTYRHSNSLKAHLKKHEDANKIASTAEQQERAGSSAGQHQTKKRSYARRQAANSAAEKSFEADSMCMNSKTSTEASGSDCNPHASASSSGDNDRSSNDQPDFVNYAMGLGDPGDVHEVNSSVEPQRDKPFLAGGEMAERFSSSTYGVKSTVRLAGDPQSSSGDGGHCTSSTLASSVNRAPVMVEFTDPLVEPFMDTSSQIPHPGSSPHKLPPSVHMASSAPVAYPL